MSKASSGSIVKRVEESKYFTVLSIIRLLISYKQDYGEYDFSVKFASNLEESDYPDRFAVREAVGVEETEQVEKDGKLLFQVRILSSSQFLMIHVPPL